MIRVDFFRYGDPFAVVDELEPYERRLIHDAVLGDHTLFTRAAGIERLWEVAAPQLAQPSRPCPRGSCIPVAVDELVASYLWLLPYPGHDDAEDPEAETRNSTTPSPAMSRWAIPAPRPRSGGSGGRRRRRGRGAPE